MGQNEEAAHYRELHDHIVKAFREEFVTPSGRIAVPTQTAMVLALHFNLLEESGRKRAIEQLGKLIAEANNHLTTGFVGTPYLNPVLSETGQHELAYTLLFHEDYPSWLYQVTQGATTIWEHWDGIKDDGRMWSADMNSFNHYAYGSIGEWLYRYVAGIRADEERPGFQAIHIEPQPGPGLDWVEASVETMYGKVVSSWTRQEQGEIQLRVVVPVNTTATVVLSNVVSDTVLLDGAALDQASDVNGIQLKADQLQVMLGSGSYTFQYTVQLTEV